MKPLYVIDLFSGAGGFSLGAHLAGFKGALAVEIDSDLSYSYRKNFPDTPLFEADLAQATTQDLLARLACSREELIGIVAGPPCQGFSVMGRRDPKDPRNELIQVFFRFVEVLKPAFFVMENVPGLLTSPKSIKLAKTLEELRSEYSITGPSILNAADFGAATNRKRAIVIGIRRSSGKGLTATELAEVGVEPVTIAEAFEGLPCMTSAKETPDGDYWAAYAHPAGAEFGRYARWAMAKPPKGLGSAAARKAHKRGEISGFQPTAHSDRVRKRFSEVPQGRVDRISRFPRLAWFDSGPTLRAGTGRDRGSYQAARPIHPKEDRVITVREAARIQGFPDWFQFHPTKWHSFRMIGNSISPPFAAAILRKVHGRLETP